MAGSPRDATIMRLVRFVSATTDGPPSRTLLYCRYCRHTDRPPAYVRIAKFRITNNVAWRLEAQRYRKCAVFSVLLRCDAITVSRVAA